VKVPDGLSPIKLISVIGTEINELGLIAEKFNNYSTGIAQDLVDKKPTSSKPFTTYLCPPNLASFAVSVYPTTPGELLALFRYLKCTHSSGPDYINPSIVNPLLHLTAISLAAVINCSLSSGIVPAPLKTTKVLPIITSRATKMN